MEIGTPFGTVEFGGIECGHGIGFRSPDKDAYIGWTERFTQPIRRPTSADDSYISSEDYIYHFQDKSTLDEKGYTSESGGDPPYLYRDDVLDAEREVQYKVIDDSTSNVPKHLAVFDISGAFESERSEDALLNFNEMQADVSLPSGIEHPRSVALDKSTETLVIGFESPKDDENVVEVLFLDVTDPVNPVIVDYLADNIAKNPASDDALVPALEYHEGDFFGGVVDKTTSPEEARVIRIQYDERVSYQQSETLWTHQDSPMPVNFDERQLSVSSSGVFAVGDQQRLTKLSPDLSVEYQKSLSDVVIDYEVLAKGSNVFVRSFDKDSDDRGDGVSVALFDASGNLRGITNNEGGISLNEGPSIYSNSEYLIFYGDDGNFYEMEINEGEKKLPQVKPD